MKFTKSEINFESEILNFEFEMLYLCAFFQHLFHYG